jgi:hypothetical protein
LVAAASKMSECPCGAHFDDTGRHYVWIAFLNIDNDQYEAEQWGRDYRLVPMNSWTVWLSGSPWFHCQLVFWNEKQQRFITFTVNSHFSSVIYDTRKQFARGWRFYRLITDAARERAMYDFLVDEYRAKRPFNQVGAVMLYIRPVDMAGTAWFCSELTIAALQRAGYLTHVAPFAVGPGELKSLLDRPSELELGVSEHPRDLKSFHDDPRSFDDV